MQKVQLSPFIKRQLLVNALPVLHNALEEVAKRDANALPYIQLLMDHMEYLRTRSSTDTLLQDDKDHIEKNIMPTIAFLTKHGYLVKYNSFLVIYGIIFDVILIFSGVAKLYMYIPILSILLGIISFVHQRRKKAKGLLLDISI